MSKLRLADWANIAEVVAAVGVIFSLVYVGFQVSENTQEIRTTNRQQLIGRAHEATNRFAVSPQLSTIIAKVADGDSLTSSEAVQYGYLIRAVLYDIQEAFVLNREDRLDDAYWGTRAALAKQYMARPQARSVYERDKALGTLLPEFVGWMDQSLTEWR